MNENQMRLIHKNIIISSDETWHQFERFLKGFPLKMDEIREGIIGFGKLRNLELEVSGCSEQFADPVDTYDPSLGLYASFDGIGGKNFSDFAKRITGQIQNFEGADKILSRYVILAGGTRKEDTIEETPGIYVARYKFPWTSNGTSIMKKGMEEVYIKFGEKL